MVSLSKILKALCGKASKDPLAEEPSKATPLQAQEKGAVGKPEELEVSEALADLIKEISEPLMPASASTQAEKSEEQKAKNDEVNIENFSLEEYRQHLAKSHKRSRREDEFKANRKWLSENLWKLRRRSLPDDLAELFGYLDEWRGKLAEICWGLAKTKMPCDSYSFRLLPVIPFNYLAPLVQMKMVVHNSRPGGTNLLVRNIESSISKGYLDPYLIADVRIFGKGMTRMPISRAREEIADKSGLALTAEEIIALAICADFPSSQVIYIVGDGARITGDRWEDYDETGSSNPVRKIPALEINAGVGSRVYFCGETEGKLDNRIEIKDDFFFKDAEYWYPYCRERIRVKRR